jgi:hypothetical protein
MTIQYINTGIIANDGTGDDLREAFIKINDNFEVLDLRIVEETIIDNAGSIGQGIYSGKILGTHELKRLVAGSNITLAASDNTITINGADSLDELLIVTDSGTVTVARGQTMSISGGEGTNTRVDGQQVIIDLDTTGIVSRDTAPALGGNLSANNFSINNANNISANNFSGSLSGLVYGYDVREFGPYLSGFDFGSFRNTYNNALEFILATVDLDFGGITPDTGDTVDLGFIN